MDLISTLIILGTLCCFSLILTRNKPGRIKHNDRLDVNDTTCDNSLDKETFNTKKLIERLLIKLGYNPEIVADNQLQFESNGGLHRVFIFGFNVKFWLVECFKVSADSKTLSSIKSAVNLTNVTAPSTIIFFDTNRNGEIVFHCIQEVDIYPLQDSSELLISKVIEALHITQHTFLQNIKTYQITTI